MPVNEPGKVDERDTGAVLRAAREEAGLSVPEVAQHLKLTVRLVEAIEADDRQRFPPPVYLRGFVRNYARLVGLDPTPLLDTYALDKPGLTLQGVEMPRLSRAGFPSLADLSSRLRTQELPSLAVAASAVGVMAVVLVGLLAWLRPADTTPDSADAGAAATAEADPRTGGGRDDAGTAASSEVGGADDAAAGGTAADRAVTEGGGDAVTGRLESPVAGDAQAAGADGVAPRRDSFGGTADTADGGIAREPEALDEREPGNGIVGIGEARPADALDDPVSVNRLTPIGDEELWFEFTEDCWVEVFDTEGEILFQDLARRRESLHLVGAGPFQIRLGYAPGVTLAYNGEAVPLAPHTRNNVALLVVGQ